MAVLFTAIHVFLAKKQDVERPPKTGHDDPILP
jgi:hypothetical protein